MGRFFLFVLVSTGLMLICVTIQPVTVLILWVLIGNFSKKQGKELTGFKNTLVLHECRWKTYQASL